MKILPTEFRGIRYRSRTEARWAVFFSALGIAAMYEPEGYQLDDGTCYLPDFFIPAGDIYIEIKGEEPSPEEKEKCQQLSRGTGKIVLLMAGDVGGPGRKFSPNQNSDGICCNFLECRRCRRPVLHYYQDPDEAEGGEPSWWGWDELGKPKCEDIQCGDKNPVLYYGVKEAIERAKTERFGVYE